MISTTSTARPALWCGAGRLGAINWRSTTETTGIWARSNEEVLTFLPRFDLYVGAVCIGQIKKEFTLFRPSFVLDCNGWQVQGDWLEWEYEVMDGDRRVMRASKELLHWTDTYAIQVVREEDVLLSLMIVLAIDAAKCSAGD